MTFHKVRIWSHFQFNSTTTTTAAEKSRDLARKLRELSGDPSRDFNSNTSSSPPLKPIPIAIPKTECPLQSNSFSPLPPPPPQPLPQPPPILSHYCALFCSLKQYNAHYRCDSRRFANISLFLFPILSLFLTFYLFLVLPLALDSSLAMLFWFELWFWLAAI